jgi:hypothetical protein
MRNRLPGLAIAAALTLGAAVGPVLRPARDVDITYQLGSANGAPLQERLRWNVTAQRLRVDPPTPGLYVIIDLRARRMDMVRSSDRSVIEAAAPASVAGLPDDAAASAQREGEETVAGLLCTDWAMRDSAGQPTTVCLTDDGVLLRARAGGQTLLTATEVHYGPSEPALFTPPAGYARKQAAPR